MSNMYPSPDDLDEVQQEDATIEALKDHLKSASPTACSRTEMSRQFARSSAGQQETLATPSLSPSALIEDASATDDKRAEPEESNPITSFGPPGIPTNYMCDEKSELFQCEHCDKSYVHKKSLAHHKRTSVCAKTRMSNNVRNAAPSPMSMTTSGVLASAPTSVVLKPIKLHQCPRCRREFNHKCSAKRHIEKSCWKVCNECCATGHDNCDVNIAVRIGRTKCSTCDWKGVDCTKLTEARQGDSPVVVWKTQGTAPDSDEDEKGSGDDAGKKSRGAAYIPSNPKMTEVPRNDVSLSRSIVEQPYFFYHGPVQSNYSRPVPMNNRNDQFGPPIFGEENDIPLDGLLPPYSFQDSVPSHDMATGNQLGAPSRSYYPDLIAQQNEKPQLQQQQSWPSSGYSIAQPPAQGLSFDSQFNTQSLPQEFIYPTIPRANTVYQQPSPNPQHITYDGHYNFDSQTPNYVPPHMATHNYQHSALPMYGGLSDLSQFPNLSNPTECQNFPDLQRPIQQPSGDVRPFSITDHRDYEHALSRQSSMFEPSSRFSANVTSLSTPYGAPNQPLTRQHHETHASTMLTSPSDWQPDSQLQQMYTPPDRFESADEFHVDPRDIFGNAEDIPFDFDGQSEHVEPGMVRSPTEQECDDLQQLSSTGLPNWEDPYSLDDINMYQSLHGDMESDDMSAQAND